MFTIDYVQALHSLYSSERDTCNISDNKKGLKV